MKLKNWDEWREHTKSKNFPKDIPTSPLRTYKKEFEGLGEFLGTGTIANQLRKYRSYQEAKKYARSLKLKSMKEWKEHTKSKNFPKDIPKEPSSSYKKEFESLGEFLGTGTIAVYLRKYRSYKEAKKYARSLKLKSKKEWKEFIKKNNISKHIPRSPEHYYKKNKGWKGWKDFLGTG